MSYKLSDGLATLSAKSKSVEDKIAQAKTEGQLFLQCGFARIWPSVANQISGRCVVANSYL
jgi:X-X-X-Leu-X-X-Gly heptad repeat protein